MNDKTIRIMNLFNILGWIFLLALFATGDKFISYLCLSSFCIGVICWFKFVIDYLKLLDRVKKKKEGKT